ncbi:hypothetical protein L218DRAFT_850422 [Marasmius fiardii PR-910]|nr:hypothetical protein L218DRAFT_850422 [Marasmius fiardii PR-910]
MHFSALFIPAFLVAQASAHGFLAQVHIGGHQYEGNSVGNPPKNSPIKQLTDVGPNKGANNPNITCGHGAKPAALVVDAMPGDKMSFDWRDGDGNKNASPLLTYMASCGNRACNDFDPMNANWFKIQETGLLSNHTWKQADLKNGDTIHASIPSNLAPGNYLVRSEILSLHNANVRGGAEFYVDCVQIRVGGNKNGKPSDKDLVKFPGGYSDDDPGIYVPKIFDGISNYVIPGPKIASFITAFSEDSGSSADSDPQSQDENKDLSQNSSSRASVEGGDTNNDSIDEPSSEDDCDDEDADYRASELTSDNVEDSDDDDAESGDSARGQGSDLSSNDDIKDPTTVCESNYTRARHTSPRTISQRSASRGRPVGNVASFEPHLHRRRFMRLRRNPLPGH